MTRFYDIIFSEIVFTDDKSTFSDTFPLVTFLLKDIFIIFVVPKLV